MQARYNHILILGNGFDLSLGLPTRYSDFISSTEFKNLVSPQNKLASYLYKFKNAKNWIDIENLLKNHSKNYPGPTFEEEHRQLSNALINYLATIDTASFDKNSIANKIIKQLIEKGDDFLIMDFNYTNTVENILRSLGYSTSQSKERHIKIHGSVAENKIIFGVEDGADILSNHIFLKKSCNINYTAINFKMLLLRANEVTFFGHSLGETDHMYFQEFMHDCTIQTNRSKKFNLFFYGMNGWYDLHRQLDTLTSKRIGFLKQYNQFSQIDVGPRIEEVVNN